MRLLLRNQKFDLAGYVNWFVNLPYVYKDGHLEVREKGKGEADILSTQIRHFAERGEDKLEWSFPHPLQKIEWT